MVMAPAPPPTFDLDLDVEVAAVVAHGLVNSLAVLSGSLHTLHSFRDSLSPVELDLTHAAFNAQGHVLQSGLETIRVHMSQPFAQAATAVGLATRALRSVAEEDAEAVLAGLLRSVEVLRSGLLAATRGLSPDVVAFLDGTTVDPAR